MNSNTRSYRALGISAFAFTVCFAAWTMYGVLITFLVDKGVYQWSAAEMGWLIGIPVLTGALMRTPMGIITDRYGGRIVFPALMLLAALPMYLTSYADSFVGFLAAGLGFGLSGAGFAVGVSYVPLWFKRDRQGTALGAFGIGNMGAAVTSVLAPITLAWLTNGETDLEGWRTLPKLYALALVVTAVLFFVIAPTKLTEGAPKQTLGQRLAPLKNTRVWRFGLYYFFAFGGFVGLAVWLIPYYVNVYSISLITAGLIAAIFSLPAALIRVFGGWASDRWGARTIMYVALIAGLVCLVLLFVPRMEIYLPGENVAASRAGTVTAVAADQIVVGNDTYKLRPAAEVRGLHNDSGERLLVFPIVSSWEDPIVQVGDQVQKGQVLARGFSHIYFQANMWIFTGLIFLVGIMMGMGTAAVFKHVADYFPTNVGVVGGTVGVLGALGGFFMPIIFGYLLSITKIWTTTWMFLALVALLCLVWMHFVIRGMERKSTAASTRQTKETADDSHHATEA